MRVLVFLMQETCKPGKSIVWDCYLM